MSMTKSDLMQPIPTNDNWTYHVKPIMDQLGNKISESNSVQQWINDIAKVEDFEEMDEWVEKNLIQHLDLAQWELKHPKTTVSSKKNNEEEDSTCL